MARTSDDKLKTSDTSRKRGGRRSYQPGRPPLPHTYAQVGVGFESDTERARVMALSPRDRVLLMLAALDARDRDGGGGSPATPA